MELLRATGLNCTNQERSHVLEHINKTETDTISLVFLEVSMWLYTDKVISYFFISFSFLARIQILLITYYQTYFGMLSQMLHN